jgi:hypothetical protein
VSDKELRGIEQLTGKKFTRNPDTGLPEAFNFGNFLATAAPIAAGIGGTIVGGPMGGAAAAGLTSAAVGKMQGKSNEQALTQGLISGISSYAGGQLMAGVPEAATQAGFDAAAQSAAQAGTQAGTETASQTAAQGAAQGAMQGGVAPAVPSGDIVGPLQGTQVYGAPGDVGPAAPSFSQSLSNKFVNFGNSASDIANNPGAALSKFGENVQAKPFSALMAGAGAYSTAMDAMAPTNIPGQAPYDPLRYPEQFPANPRTWNAPPAGYRPGYDPEYRYFAGGGYVPPEPKKDKDSGGIPDFLSMGVMGAVPAAMGMDRDSITQFAPMNIMRNLVQSPDGELGAERERYRALYQAYMANPANQQAASMASGQPMGMAKGGLASMRPEGSYTANLMNEAKAALLGEHPRPSDAISKFRETFGDEALALLKDRVTGGRVRGAGGGMDDLVPGTIEGRQKVRLADGEFVLPAHIVSAIGDGSTDHGVRRLKGMMDSIYKQKYKSDGLPKRLKKGTLVDE